MSNDKSLQPWVAVAVSTASLAVSVFAAYNSSSQAETAANALATANDQLATAKASYETALKQLVIAKDSQETSEKNYKIAEKSFEFQKSLIEQDNSFAFVFNQEFLDAVDAPVANQTALSFSMFNKTKRAQSYRVKVESEGFSVFWPNRTPTQSQFSIYLDRNSTVVSPEAPYNGTFVIWHHKSPSPSARLIVKVNDKVVLERHYTYDSRSKAYALLGG